MQQQDSYTIIAQTSPDYTELPDWAPEEDDEFLYFHGPDEPEEEPQPVRWTPELSRDGKYWVAVDTTTWNWSDPFAPGNLVVVQTFPEPTPAPATQAQATAPVTPSPAPELPSNQPECIQWTPTPEAPKKAKQVPEEITPEMQAIADALQMGRSVYSLTISMDCQGVSDAGLSDQLAIHRPIRNLIKRFFGKNADVVWVRSRHMVWSPRLNRWTMSCYHSHFAIIGDRKPDMQLLRAHLTGLTGGGFRLHRHNNLAILLIYMYKHKPTAKDRQRYGRWIWQGHWGPNNYNNLYKSYFVDKKTFVTRSAENSDTEKTGEANTSAGGETIAEDRKDCRILCISVCVESVPRRLPLWPPVWPRGPTCRRQHEAGIFHFWPELLAALGKHRIWRHRRTVSAHNDAGVRRAPAVRASCLNDLRISFNMSFRCS